METVIEMNALYINNNNNDNNDNNDDIVFIDNILHTNTDNKQDTPDIERKDSIQECPICFLELDGNTETHSISMPCCKKDVHVHCIYTCLKIKNTCPFCRKPYNSETTPHNTTIFNYNNCIIQCDNANLIIPIENEKISNKFLSIVIFLLVVFAGAYTSVFIYPIIHRTRHNM